ncbi:MAG: sulfatase-like hydrolase/transferase [Flavobacteriales bacterium]|nr:sulfatase-like hydrolase/transferase [Flavobacteriales bacterium]
MLKWFSKYYYLLLILPVFVLLTSIRSNLESNFTPERVLYAYLILYFAAILFSKRQLKIGYLFFVYLVSVVITYVEWSYVSLYHERVNTSTIFIVLETNSIESKEFLSQYLNFNIVFVGIILTVYSILVYKITCIALLRFQNAKQMYDEILLDLKNLFHFIVQKTKWIYTIISINQTRKIAVISGLLLVFISFYFLSNHHKQHLAFRIAESIGKFNDEKEKFNHFRFGKIQKHTFSAKSNSNINEPETFVLVIGESTARGHLELYNYYRKTTPNLQKMKNDLVVFQDVISPHTHTIPCLEKMLTLGNYENPDKKFEGSIIDILKESGFKTYWISNQIPVGIYETMTTTFAKSCDEVYFTNLGDEKDQLSYDEKVFPFLDKSLKENQTKKFIIIHLLGTHVQYQNRYPKEYDVFKDTPNSKYHSNEIYKTINYYDNAVLYNDYIVSTIIEKVKSATQNRKASLIYLSDHGEDVYETVDMAGHSEAISSNPMYIIPFVFWSNNTNQTDAYESYTSRKYMTDDLIFSIADLLNISFIGYDPERSIFNSNFKERNRIVNEGKDFDKTL